MSTDRPKEKLDAILYQAVRSLGWLPPQTEEEVEAAEGLDASDAELPDSLLDPANVFREDRHRHHTNSQAALSNPEVIDELARAARQGKDIPPEIERQMRVDRDVAERETKDDE